MRYSGTWLTPEDEVILEALRDHGPASPIDMPDLTAVDLSPAYIEERCTTLTGRGGLVSFRHGQYRLARKGEAYLAGELDPSEFE